MCQITKKEKTSFIHISCCSICTYFLTKLKKLNYYTMLGGHQKTNRTMTSIKYEHLKALTKTFYVGF